MIAPSSPGALEPAVRCRAAWALHVDATQGLENAGGGPLGTREVPRGAATRAPRALIRVAARMSEIANISITRMRRAVPSQAVV